MVGGDLEPNSDMFEEPQAKRIRRSEVFEDAESDSSEEEVTDTTTIKDIQNSIGLAYHFDYDLVENESGKITKFAHIQIDEPIHEDSLPNEEAFEFRLFSAKKPSDEANTSTATELVSQKINIRSPTPDKPSDGRFINPHRPLSYYLASDPPTPDIAAAAVSGDEILESSQCPWPGMQLPWRVTHLPNAKMSALRPRKSDVSSALKADSRDKRKPNKRRRILLRTRERAKDEKTKEKEAHLREKKTRLNREKKIKRKAKEKAAKAAGKVEVEGSDL